MCKCGLLGRKLSHSYSPAIHSHLGTYSYELFEIEPDELGLFFENSDFTGINVTIPYKKAVIPYLDSLTDTAQKLGAVNTILRRDGKLIGHNTDWYGFTTMVNRSGLNVQSKKVLVLGSGGASNTAVAVLTDMGALPVVISRSGKNHYDNLNLHKDAKIIVNATPVGMYPFNGAHPVDLSLFPDLEGVLDLIYNPARTKLLMEAEIRGLVAENGLWMLVAQAKESADWFTARIAPTTVIDDIYRKMKAEMENIILIGMPGCGKTSVATILAEKLGRKMVDTDREIEKEAGCSIPEIFAQGGEDAFRSIETKVLTQFGQESELIIATGGGCVTRHVNYPLLHQNGKIVWLQRSIENLPRDGRPLSKDADLFQMYTSREPLYQLFADATVGNDGTLEQTSVEILRLLGDWE